MPRTDLTPTMAAEVVKPVIRPVWIVRLDIKDDPLYVWTGRGTLVPAGTGDTALDGFSFDGLGALGEIEPLKDTDGGSSAATLTLPGIDLNEVALQQIVTDARLWQFRRAWIWIGMLNESLSLLSNPIRVKTARMDQMKLDADGTKGTVSVILESHQAYSSQPLGTRYIQQSNIDPADISQNFVHDLFNRRPNIGEKTPGSATHLTSLPIPGFGVGIPIIRRGVQ